VHRVRAGVARDRDASPADDKLERFAVSGCGRPMIATRCVASLGASLWLTFSRASARSLPWLCAPGTSGMDAKI
jgi:hypothetical protein